VGNGAGQTDTWIDRIIASSDAVLGYGDDRVVGEFVHQGFLEPNTSYSRSETLILPPGFTGHDHWFVKTDAKGQVFENGLTTNNAAEAGNLVDVMPIPYADLIIRQAVTDATAQSGGTLRVSWRVDNNGMYRMHAVHRFDQRCAYFRVGRRDAGRR
jgi:hypothetical protein